MRAQAFAGLSLSATVFLVTAIANGFMLNGKDWSYKPDPMGEEFTICPTGMPAGAVERTKDGALGWNYQFFKFAFAPESCPGIGLNGVNLVDFGNLGNVLAVAISWTDTTDPTKILECDIRFSGDVTWYTGVGVPPPNAIDWWSVAAHETGHCLGLGHEDDITPFPVMASGLFIGEARRTLTSDDVEGRNTIYGLVLSRPGAESYEYLGWSLAPLGDDILVGAPYESGGPGISAGAVHLFDGATGALIGTFPNPTPTNNDRFGIAVGAIGSNPVVGAPGDETGGPGAGAVYVLDASSGVPLVTMTPPTAASYGNFGEAVATFGGYVVVGAPFASLIGSNEGAVFVFDGSSGTMVAQCPNPTPASGDQFGRSVAALGTRLLVGAPEDDSMALNSGAAYLFDIVGSSCTLFRDFFNPIPALGDIFGSSVAGANDRVLIGAPLGDSPTNNAGAAHLFVASTGGLVVSLRRPGTPRIDDFGWSVAFVGSNVLVGAPDDDVGATAAGGAYLFDIQGNTASLLQSYHNPSPEDEAKFGYAVSGVGSSPIIGVPSNNQPFENSGIAYGFRPRCGNGVPQAAEEECDDGDTIDADCCSSTCQREPDGSTCNDGNACTTDQCLAGACQGTCQGGIACSPPCGGTCQISGPNCVCE